MLRGTPQSRPIWPTLLISAPQPRRVPPTFQHLFLPAPLEPALKVDRSSSKPCRNTNNSGRRDQTLPLPPDFFFGAFAAVFFVAVFFALVFLLARSPTMGRSFISAARHKYQLATLRWGRQRSPYASNSFGLGNSTMRWSLANPLRMP